MGYGMVRIFLYKSVMFRVLLAGGMKGFPVAYFYLKRSYRVFYRSLNRNIYILGFSLVLVVTRI